MITGGVTRGGDSAMTSGGLWGNCSFISISLSMSLPKKLGQMLDLDDFFDWLNHGVYKGWVSLPVCDSHEGVPLSDEEAAEFDDGYDPCVFVLRIWSQNIDDETKNAGIDAED